MLHLALILFIIAVIVGILGFGITNAINHIAKFLFYIIVIIFLIIILYAYFSFSPTHEPIPPETSVQT